MSLPKLELREISWETIFECIRNSEINAKGSFWAGIQSLEQQLSDIKEIRSAREGMTEEDAVELLRSFFRLIDHLDCETDGRVIVGGYGSYSKNQPAPDITAILKRFGFNVAGSATCSQLPITHVAWVEVE